MPSRDFAREVKNLLSCRIEEEATRSREEVGSPSEIGEWVREHEDEARSVVCGTPEFDDMPFCETGHDSPVS